ncbi:putative armadillo-like helical, importin beta family [Helianthus anomalus]
MVRLLRTINAIGQLATDLGPNLQVQYHQRVLPALATAMDGLNNLRVQEHFQKYYDAIMPYLKAILVNANDKANRMLRAKAMECISLVGMSVGKEKFRDGAKQVMEVLMLLQGSQMETDDPTTSYMLQVGVNF